MTPAEDVDIYWKFSSLCRKQQLMNLSYKTLANLLGYDPRASDGPPGASGILSPSSSAAAQHLNNIINTGHDTMSSSHAQSAGDKNAVKNLLQLPACDNPNIMFAYLKHIWAEAIMEHPLHSNSLHLTSPTSNETDGDGIDNRSCAKESREKCTKILRLFEQV